MDNSVFEGYNAKIPEDMNAYKNIDAFLKKNGFGKKSMPTASPRERRFLYWVGDKRVVVTAHYAGRDISVEIPGIRTEAMIAQSVLPDFIEKHLGPYVEGKTPNAPGINNKKPVKIMEEGNEVNVVVEQIKMPSFNEFCKMNESVETEMNLYSEIAARVDQLKDIYGDKAVVKTGIIKSLEAMNRLILTAQKEKQPQESGASQQPVSQPQSVFPQAQTQPVAQPQAQTQPAAQSQEEKK